MPSRDLPGPADRRQHQSPGFFTWEPGWLSGVGWEPGAGNPNDNLTNFDFSGNALPMLATAYKP